MKKIFHKSRIYPLVLIVIVFLVWKYRENNKLHLISFEGTTMGPIRYSVKYMSNGNQDYRHEVDSILEKFNSSLNHYLPDSEISQFNRDSVFEFSSPYFPEVLSKSKEIYLQTNGAFDPTIGPLINAWGFGPAENEAPDSVAIDSMLQIVHFENLDFDSQAVWKKKKNIQLDFSAIAKGQGVDVVFEFLVAKGLQNVFVEIGGEVRAQGKNENDQPWKIGIVNPAKANSADLLYGTFVLENRAMATSGNYYNYIEEDGRVIVHTINPKNGYPIASNLLSASVIAHDCMTADAFATAFMVLGLEKSIELSKKINEISVVLIYSEPNGKLNHFVSEELIPLFSTIQTPEDDS